MNIFKLAVLLWSTVYHLMGEAFMAYWVVMDGAFISLNGWGICHVMGGAFIM